MSQKTLKQEDVPLILTGILFLNGLIIVVGLCLGQTLLFLTGYAISFTNNSVIISLIIMILSIILLFLLFTGIIVLSIKGTKSFLNRKKKI
ncbi:MULTISPECIES: hypothetical protein [Oceanobacillus]|uniref:hypothetical protein n=1 Tax=Oceanobacillus TaxID=182709 RepID=UPI000595C85A|nr:MULTISPECIES: hypothetical protein [Oceanobacillus]